MSSDAGAASGVPANFVANDGDGRDPDPNDPGDWVTDQDIAAYPSFCDPPAVDSSWHGTHMAGTIVGVWNNGVGNPPPPGTSTAGIAPNVRLLPLRALGKCGGSSSDVIDAMRFAAGIPVPGATGTIVNLTQADIINMSLGTGAGACSTSYQQAVDAVVARGVLIVAAAGNDGVTSVTQPANCSGVLAVAAHTINGDNADYSNVGPEVAISAPGGGTPTQLSSVIVSGDTGYYTWSSLLFGATGPTSAGAPPNQNRTGPAVGGFTGTSSATAHASAVAALVKSVRRTASPSEIIDIIRRTARPHPSGGYCATGQPGAGTCGAGLLDAAAAVAEAAATAPPPMADGGRDQTVSPGTAVTLDGRGSVAFGGRTIASYAWRQIDNGATPVALSGPSNPQAGFTAPSGNQTLVFELTVTDNSVPPKADTIDVAITVQSPPSSGGGGGAFPLWQLLLLAAFGLAALIRGRT